MEKSRNEINEVTEEYSSLMPVIISEAKKIADDCEDFFVKTLKNRMTFTPEETIRFEQEDLIRPEVTLKPTEYAFGQLCDKIDFPAKLYRKQTAKLKESRLANTNINTHMEHYSGKLMVRTYKNIIRGILSDRYTSFDSDKIIELFAEAIEDNKDIPVTELGICGYVNTYERLHVRIINKTPLEIDGRKAYAGLTINTSDVGMAKISVKFYIYTGLESNGICIDQFRSELFEEPHIHISETEIKNRLKQAFINFPMIMANAKIYIQNAETFELTNSALYDEDSVQNRMLGKILNLTKKDIRSIIDISEFRPKNLWGYVSSIGEYARTLDFERRIELERGAGRILLYPDKFGIVAG